MKRFLLGCAALIALPASAQTIAITGGKVIIGDGSAPVENGTVVITNGRVVAAGAGVAIPAGAERVDASGKWVTPGIVAGFTRMGLVGVDAVDPSNDTEARNSPFNASLDMAPAINPDVAAMAVNRAAGVTRAIVSPDAGNAIFAGQGAVIDTGSDLNPVTKAKAFQFVEFGETGARLAGGSRPALIAAFKTALGEASEAAKGIFRDDAMLKRADALALVPVVNGTMKLFVHAESAPDILMVLALKKDYPALSVVLVGATEGWRVGPQIAAAKVGVLASALNDLPDSFEQLAATQANNGRMKKAGVEVAQGCGFGFGWRAAVEAGDDEIARIRRGVVHQPIEHRVRFRTGAGGIFLHEAPQPRRIVGGGDGQRLDVVSARREQPCDARQRAGFILQSYGDDVAHIAEKPWIPRIAYCTGRSN